MNYQESLDFLFNALPMYQRVGSPAFKKDLSNTYKLCKRLGNPQDRLKCIHIAGTNGKGSTAHALASILQYEGYKTGLYTSPHLKSFRERIKINGLEIPEKDIIEFVNAHRSFLQELQPSFFEMTVALAFLHFEKEKVDIACIEVGMGGRFDSTNVIQPLLSIITNIGMDHEAFLGNTLEKIAFEKAGIIKPQTPVIIGQSHPETIAVFWEKALQENAPLYFADQEIKVQFKGAVKEKGQSPKSNYELQISNPTSVNIQLDLMGKYQEKNLPAIWKAFEILNQIGISIKDKSIHSGLKSIISSTGLKGRWQILRTDPLTICDTGHNIDGFKFIIEQIASISYGKLSMVLGMVKDKDIASILSLLPKKVDYYFCQANLPRALPADQLKKEAEKFGLKGDVILNVNQAIEKAIKFSGKEDLIFVGGSTFVVAEIDEL